MCAVGLILLAAGGSARLGRPKQFLEYQGKTLLRRAAEAAAASMCRPLTVVLGANAAKMRTELGGLPLEIIENPDWEQGMASSLRAGLDALRDQPVDAVAVILCDQPLLTTEVIDALAAAFCERSPSLVVSEYGGVLGVPALFSRTLFPELTGLTGAEGARKVIGRHAAEAARVPFPGGLVDIDTPEDAAALGRG